MATTLLPFTVTVPAGTAVATPQTTSLPVGTNVVERIRWRVPPGPLGNMGWYLAMGGVQVIPYAQKHYIIADDESDDIELVDLPDTGAWQLVAYNTGNFDHDVYLWYSVTPVQLATPAPALQPLSVSDLSGTLSL